PLSLLLSPFLLSNCSSTTDFYPLSSTTLFRSHIIGGSSSGFRRQNPNLCRLWQRVRLHVGRAGVPRVQGLHQRAPTLRQLPLGADRKSTRLNSSHVKISYAVFCLKKKKIITTK